MSSSGLLPFARPSRADQIFARFVQFHLANPAVWDLFQRFADEMRAAGYPRYSARAIIHRVRWEVALKTTTGEDESNVKINNDFSPYYGRMYMATRPDAGGFFETRIRKSANRDAADVDRAVFRDGPPEDEERLLATLRELASR